MLDTPWYEVRRNYIKILCGVDVSCETPPMNSVLRFLLFSLRQFVLDVIQPPPLRSSSPSFPRPPSPSLACLFFFSGHTTSTYTFLSFCPARFIPILCSLVTPLSLNILAATSNFFSCPFFTAHLSAPYITQHNIL